MISFEPTEEEVALQDVARRFALERIRPLARACEERAGVAEELQRDYWDIGLGQLGSPESCGGIALGMRAEVLVEEELAWGDPGICVGLSRPSTLAAALGGVGDGVRQRWLPPLLADRTHRAASALVDSAAAPSGGTSCRAREHTEGVEITGRKDLVFGVERAEWVLLSCVLTDQFALALVPVTTPGVAVSMQEHQLGLRAAPAATVSLDHARLPRDQLLTMGQPAAIAIVRGAVHDLLLWTARAVGTARAAFEYAARYAMQRTTFGKPIAEHQAVAFMVANMGIQVDAARNLLWQAAWAVDKDSPEAVEPVCSAALYAAEAAVLTTSDAVQVLGGHGYIQDHPVELWMRDARCIATVSVEGTAFLRRVRSRQGLSINA
jgi:alkylation response protein AidB-like acyl-CoA dehydrogenase